MVELTVVVPVYGCADCLAVLHERLVRTLETTVESFEVVFVDDRSPDGSWALLCDLAERDERVRAIRLSRNFGQHAAITAGLTESTGRWTVVMDCDLQDPPEEIPRLLDKAAAGYDIVLSRRILPRQSRRRDQAEARHSVHDAPFSTARRMRQRVFGSSKSPQRSPFSSRSPTRIPVASRTSTAGA